MNLQVGNLAASRLPAGEDRETPVKGRDVRADLMPPEQFADPQRLARAWDAALPR